MNILLVTELYPAYSNQPKSEVTYAIHYFAEEWKKYGHNVKVLNTHWCYPKIFNISSNAIYKNRYYNNHTHKLDDIEIFRVPVVMYPKIKKYSKISMKKIEMNIHEFLNIDNFLPDIIVCHMIHPSLEIGVRLKKIYNIPLIMTLHSTDIIRLKEKGFYKQLKRLYRHIDAYGFRSYKIRDEFIINYSEFINSQKIKIINSGIEEELIKLDCGKKTFNNPIKIITVSSLIPRKNVNTVIEGLKKLINDFNIELEIVGDGPLKDDLLNLIQREQLSEKIKLISELNRHQVIKKMQNSDIFIMVSKNETLGLVYLEAMASGCITIGSKDEGIDGIIIDNKNGFLCEAGNSHELEKIVNKILVMTEYERNDIIFNSIKSVSKLTKHQVAQEYIQFMQEIINLK